MKRNYPFIVLLLFVGTTLFGQGIEVTGVVTSAEDQMSIPGVTVAVEGTTKGTITNVDGNYSIMAEPGEVLVFSYVGMTTQRIPFEGQSTIDVVLELSTEQIDELVVVGYGTQKRSLVTGAISKLSSEDLLKNQPQRIEQAIQGKISGVMIAAEGGSPGAGLTINIRGTSSNKNSNPLFIVDGMKTSGIDFLDPSDIESIEILKDAASSAIYGAEGGNGVVLITTKRGKPGIAQVSYNAYYGNQYYNGNLELLDGPAFTDYFRDALTYEWAAKGRTPEQIATKIEDADLPPVGEYFDQDTDWLDEITQVAPMMSHNLSLTGGTDKTSFSSSVNYDNQDGMTGGEKANYQRITARLNATHQANDWLTVGVNAIYSHRTRSSLSENNEFGGVYGNALLIDPLTPTVYPSDEEINPEYATLGFEEFFVRNDDGLPFGMSSYVKNEVINPLAQIYTTNGTWSEDKVLAGAFVEIEPINGLKIRSSYDIDAAHAMSESWQPASFYHDLIKDIYSRGSQNFDKYNTWQFDNVVSYTRGFGKHNVTAMLGSHAEEHTNSHLSGWGKNLIRESYAFSHPALAQNDTLVKPNDVLGGERGDPIRAASIFGRFSYNYGEKYMLNVTVRSDKSSMLSPNGNYQKGIFPSASVGWVISREDFWQVPVVNFMKARYSYGTNGSLGAISPFDYVPLIGFTGSVGFTGAVYADAAGNVINGAAPVKVSNEALGWETTEMHNVGVDVRLMESRLSGTVEYFYKKTSDLLTEAAIPGYVGNTPPEANTGIVINKGLELELSYRNREGEFQYEVGGNVSFLKNVVDYFPGGDNGANLGVGGTITRIDEEYPLFYFYGYDVDGVWEDEADILENNFYSQGDTLDVAIQRNAIPGDIKIVDVNNDSTINAADRTYIGSPYPDLMAGLYFSAFYKGFDFSLNFTASYGNEIYFGVYRSDLNMPNRPVHFATEAWSPENTDADFFRPTLSSRWNYQHNSMFVEDGSYLKLKNIELGYTLPSQLTQRIQISTLRIYASINNALLFTNYRGADPEIGYTAGISSFGVDRGYYPQARQVLFGINVSF